MIHTDHLVVSGCWNKGHTCTGHVAQMGKQEMHKTWRQATAVVPL